MNDNRGHEGDQHGNPGCFALGAALCSGTIVGSSWKPGTRATFRNEIKLDVQFVQDNHSRSGRAVLRGLHYQIRQPQGKLVRVARGQIFDVAVDLRKSSPTFGRWVGHELSDDNHRQLWIPPGSRTDF